MALSTPAYSRPEHSLDPLPAVPSDAAGVSLWLRANLDRRLTIAVVEPPDESRVACQTLCAALATYPEVRLLVRAPAAGAYTSADAEGLLADLRAEDLDAVLVWTSSALLTTAPLEGACSMAWQWPRAVATAADHLGLFDLGLVALIGQDVTRTAAHKLGYEDGFTLELPVPALILSIAQDALRREAYRRRGSSPPCYL